MSEQADKLNLNPVFKEQLCLLQGAAKNEFNIQISIDKMVHDEKYRDTVLNELSELNNATLNKYIHLLQRSSVYIKATKQPFSLDALPSLSEEKATTQKDKLQNNKHHSSEHIDEKPFNFVAWFAILILFFCVFFAWQEGYLQISTQQQTVLSVQTELPSTPPYSTESNNVQGNSLIQAADPIEQVVITSESIPLLTLPNEKKIITLRLHGSNTVGENLAPALLEAYLKTQGVKEMLWIQGEQQVERELQYIQNNHINAIQLHAHGSSTGFKDLLNGKADMAMSSRKIKEKERDNLQSSSGDLELASQEYIIALDGLAIIVNPNNPLNGLTNDILAKIFSGEIVNWSELGGPDQVINVYARDENSGTWDTFNNLLLKSHHKQLINTAQRFESSSQLSENVANDPGAIGFIGLPYVNNSKAISIAESQGSLSIYPTHFTISTEDYPLARRLYLYRPLNSSDMVQGFADFVVSLNGQEIVEKEGLISQNIKLESIYPMKNAPSIYNSYTDIAKRLSVNFRFQINSNELDNKGKRDLPRLIEYMQKNPGRRIALMGFSDSVGDSIKNIKLSLSRAKVIENELLARGVNVVAIEGFGDQMPIASNSNAFGRSKNRRVEVWFF